jgi:hypothetical protein
MVKILSAPLALLVLGNVLGTAAFSVQSTARSSTRSQGQLQLLQPLAVHTSKPRTLGSPLFSASSQQHLQQQPGNRPLGSLFRRLLLAKSTTTATATTAAKKFRRSLTLFLTVSFLWLGAASFSTLPSHASTAAALGNNGNPVVERLTQVISPSLDTMVNRYVKDHMFDDDVYDPVESIYREANDDAELRKYPHRDER